jgi:ABC-type multidrug transport system fused ATPase/permease subunit
MILREGLVSTLETRTLWQSLRDAFGLLDRHERSRAVLLVSSMVINAGLELVGLAAILPFVHLMLEPAPLSGDGTVARILRFSGIADVTTAIVLVGLGLVALIIIKNLYSFWHISFQARFCARAEARLAIDLLDRVVHAPYVWLIKRNSSIIRDVVVGQAIEWSRGVIRPTLQLLNDLLFLVVAAALLIIASPLPGLGVSVAAGLLAFVVMRIVRPHVDRHVEAKRKAIRLAGVTAMEGIAGGRDVRLSGAGPLLVNSFKQEMKTYAHSDARARQWQLVPRLAIEVIGFASLVGVALGALWAGAGRAEVASLLALYAVVAVRAIPLATQAVSAVTAIAGALPAVGEIRALIASIPGETQARIGKAPAWSMLTFNSVHFAYSLSTESAVGPIDLQIARGKAVGIVGASGAGKSTLVDLAAGLLPPSSGEIAIDNNPLEGELLAGWRQRVAYVAQTPFLIDATLAENIVFGAESRALGASHLSRAIEAAGLDRVVDQLPNGVNTPLGERGVRLSGGQRQRVAIARAIYRDSDLLILDEATSALDSITEREITDAIDSLRGVLTMLIVAHRLSTVMHCDEIVVLDHGKIIARGTHAEVLARSPAYRRMVEAQMLVQRQ